MCCLLPLSSRLRLIEPQSGAEIGYPRSMDSHAVSALSSVGITSVPVEPILGGWAYWTFDVGSRFIAKFPRNDEIAEAAVREIAILPALSNEVSAEAWKESSGTRNEKVVPYFGSSDVLVLRSRRT